LARLETSGTSPEMQRTDVGELVSEIVADAQWEAEERRCRVNFERAEECYADVNVDLLRSAVEDVIRNGIRYTALFATRHWGRGLTYPLSADTPNTETPQSSGSATTDPEFRCRSWATSSARSTAWPAREIDSPAASAWDWRLQTASRGSIVATSTRTTDRTVASKW
jgi:hypothetical protein